MKNQSGTIKTNLELNRVVMGGSGGYRRLTGGSDHFSLQTDKHFIIIYISSSLPRINGTINNVHPLTGSETTRSPCAIPLNPESEEKLIFKNITF